MSEGGPLKTPVKGLWPNCLWMGETIVRDLSDLKAAAWVDWQFIDGGAWGSLVPNWKDRSFKISKRFYIQCHFARFIRPGYTIVQSGDENTLAAIAPDKSRLVVVAVNRGGRRTIKLDLSRFRKGNYSAAVYTTTGEENLQKDDVKVAAGMAEPALPEQSIVTVVVPG
jgi:hypothetical protein